MAKIWTKIQRWWLFNLANPVVRKGEAGGFKWCFRRYYIDISTLSGNFSVRFTADEHPYGYLLAGEGDENIRGFCQILYTIGKTLTTEQLFADEIVNALNNYEVRLVKSEVTSDGDPDSEMEEKIALEEVKAVQEYVEASPKEKRKIERDSRGRFKKVVKELEKSNGTVEE